MAWYNLRRRQPAPPQTRIASAQPITQAHVRTIRRTKQSWQEQARGYARTLGVVRFANGISADSASRCPLRPERLDLATNEWTAEDDPVVAGVIDAYHAEDATIATSQATLIRQHFWHRKVSGDLWQVVEQGPSGLEWSIRGQDAVELRANGAVIRDVPGGSLFDGGARLVPLEWVRRLWRPDEDWPALAISPMRGIIADCDRYVALSRRIKREAESVLIQNGLLWTPETVHQGRYRPGVSPGGPSDWDRDFYDLAEEAFSNEDSVVGIAPFSVHYGDADATPPKWIEMGRVMDPNGIAYRQEALEAIARGTDLPQSLVTGEQTNHWSRWAFDEAYVKSSVAPDMDAICHGDLTVSMLRPQLRSLAQQGRWLGDPRSWRVGYDPTPIIVHPDQAASSLTLYLAGLLRGDRVVEAHGFRADDIPDAAELEGIMRFLAETRGRSLSPGELTPIGPAETVELPPAPAMAALGAGVLAPFPSEAAEWWT